MVSQAEQPRDKNLEMADPATATLNSGFVYESADLPGDAAIMYTRLIEDEEPASLFEEVSKS